MFDLINTLLAAIPIKSKYHSHNDIEVYPTFWISVFGDLSTCKSVLVISHGMGGSKNSSYIVSFANRFANDSTMAVITLDSSGICSNVGTPNIWGVAGTACQNNYYDEIIEYVLKINPICKIYLSGFSGGAGILLSYLTCTQGYIPNIHNDKISHSFLISIQSHEYNPQLSWIRENSGILAQFISVCHGIDGIKFHFYKKNFKKIRKILTSITDVKLTNYHVSASGKWYRHNKNTSQKLNATIIVSKADPITRWHEEGNIVMKHQGYNIIDFPGGGHCGFWRIDGKRDHEELIYEYIKKDQG